MRGKGYAIEAASAITEWTFQRFDVNYIIGTAEIENVASQKVLEKCGYTIEDTKNLLVHIEGNRYYFKYYRHYRETLGNQRNYKTIFYKRCGSVYCSRIATFL